jgi:hypothetical protein
MIGLRASWAISVIRRWIVDEFPGLNQWRLGLAGDRNMVSGLWLNRGFSGYSPERRVYLTPNTAGSVYRLHFLKLLGFGLLTVETRAKDKSMNVLKTTATALAAAFALFSAAGGASAAVYVAGAEFSSVQGGTTGVWRYGRLDGAGGTFTEGAWNGTRYQGPDGGVYLLVGAGSMHPGCVDAGANTCVADQAFANLRFTAPTAGDYTATFQVRLIDPASNPFTCNGCQIATGGFPDYRRDGVRMLLNTDTKDLPTWTPELQAQSFTYQTLTQTFTLAAGGTIDFSVDHNGARTCPGCVPLTRFNLYDSVEYTATVSSAAIPEPATWAMMIIGFGAAGSVIRRRRTLAA